MSRAVAKPAREVSTAAAEQVLPVGEGHRVDQKVEAAPPLRESGEHGGDLTVVGDVERFDDGRSDALGQGPHAALQGIALKGEGQLRTLVVGALGDAPGQRALVGCADDQTATAGQQPAGGGGSRR